jgi:hypothetical protein
MPHHDEYDDHGDDRYDDRARDDRARDDRGDDRDAEYDDYEGRPRRGARPRALEKVSLPAIFLMIVGCLGLGMSVLNITIELMGLNNDNPFQFNKPNPNDPNAKAAENVGKVIGGVVQVVWSLIVFFGGVQMKGLKSRGYVFFSCIWAMLPCNLCCLLGLPFGIWGLVVVNDPVVRRGFELTARGGSYG